MHLSTEQIERYRSTLSSLIEFADVRLGVTQRLPSHEEEHYLAERAMLVVRELWRNLDIIGDFVRENPDDLSDRCLSTARSWQDGLCCRCVISGYDVSGNAVVETEVGSFLVRGIACEPEVQLPPAPVGFKTALLPFDDALVFGMPICSTGHVGDGEIEWMERRAAAAGITGVASTPSDLRARGALFARERSRRELREIAEARPPAKLPSGFHRGALAGLDPEERLAEIERHLPSWPEHLVGTGMDAMGLTRGGGTRRVRMACGDSGTNGTRVAADGEAVAVAHACVLLYGVIALVDAYAQYRALSDAPMSPGCFYDVVEREAGRATLSYELWEHEGVQYLRELAFSRIGAEQSARAAMDSRPQEGRGETRLMGYGPMKFAAMAQEEYDRMQDYCEELLALQAITPRRPVERQMVSHGMTHYLLELDTVAALRGFIDAHMPDGQDDYVFADAVACALASMIVTCGAKPEHIYPRLDDLGLMRCEGTEWSDTLGAMVVNVYNSLPQWSSLGWSPRERNERLTGRRAFYAANGAVMRVGSDDPCPCGSGRRYRGCCGR